MALNQVVRFALSDAGQTAALGVNLKSEEIVSKLEAGSEGLLIQGSEGVTGICHDYSGNVYVTDLYTHSILKIDEGGELSIFAGHPSESGDVLATKDIRTARFYNPRGIACDRSGNIFVADTGNNKIKVINNKGVSVLAGNGSTGRVDGVGTIAQFNGPYDVAVDHAGRVYVADTGNHAVRKVDNNGYVTTLAGNGNLGDLENSSVVDAESSYAFIAALSSPQALSVDREGNVLVLDTGNYKIKKIVPRGWIYLLSGNGVTGTSLGNGPVAGSRDQTWAYTCNYNELVSCDVDESGNLYVVDQGNDSYPKSRLIKVDSDGRPGVIAEFNDTTSNRYVDGVTCTPGQKLLVTVSENDEETSSSSSSESV